MITDDRGAWQWFLTTVFTLAHFLFGRWSLPLQILVTFIVIDYFTGLSAAFAGKRVSSSIGYTGILKKVGILVLISISHMLDCAITPLSPILSTAVTWAYIGNEGISILENLSEMGIWIPPVLKEALGKLRKDDQKLPTERS